MVLILKVAEENIQEIKKKVPILGDIPLIKHLFRYKKENKEPSVLLLFVTAKIIGPDGRYLKVQQDNQ